MALAASVPQPPRLPERLVPTVLGALRHDDDHAEVEFSDLDLSDQEANGVELREVKVSKLDLTGSRLDQLTLADGEFVSCDFSNLQGRGVEGTRVSIEASRLTGISLPEAALHDVSMRSCRVDLASLAYSELVRVTFEDCVMAEASFLDAKLSSVIFHGCDLTRADFRGARLDRCEFRRTSLDGLEGVENLRGAAIDSPGIVAMAEVWAATLGIRVLDAE